VGSLLVVGDTGSKLMKIKASPSTVVWEERNDLDPWEVQAYGEKKSELETPEISGHDCKECNTALSFILLRKRLSFLPLEKN
jgi:hypothetical protein